MPLPPPKATVILTLPKPAVEEVPHLVALEWTGRFPDIHSHDKDQGMREGESLPSRKQL